MLGEHTDTSEGYCLPAAVDRGLLCAFAPARDSKTRVTSLEVPGLVELDASFALSATSPSFGRYVEAVAQILRARAVDVPPLSLSLSSTIPPAGGMSSSAALCVALALSMSTAANVALPPLDLALMAQAAEHRVGVNCGLMDQYAIVHGKEGSALLLDTRTKTHIEVPLALSGWVFVVGDTRKSRGLVDSEYNVRRAQVDEAARILDGGSAKLKNLRDATHPLIEEKREELGPLLYRRALHVVGENARTREAAELLLDHGTERESAPVARKLGSLLDASHASLRDSFEVSCSELDALVVALREQGDSVVAGARMMGGGFGGCVIALVSAAALEEVLSRTETSYHAATGKKPAFFSVQISPGARLVAPELASLS